MDNKLTVTKSINRKEKLQFRSISHPYQLFRYTCLVLQKHRLCYIWLAFITATTTRKAQISGVLFCKLRLSFFVSFSFRLRTRRVHFLNLSFFAIVWWATTFYTLEQALHSFQLYRVDPCTPTEVRWWWDGGAGVTLHHIFHHRTEKSEVKIHSSVGGCAVACGAQFSQHPAK